MGLAWSLSQPALFHAPSHVWSWPRQKSQIPVVTAKNRRSSISEATMHLNLFPKKKHCASPSWANHLGPVCSGDGDYTSGFDIYHQEFMVCVHQKHSKQWFLGWQRNSGMKGPQWVTQSNSKYDPICNWTICTYSCVCLIRLPSVFWRTWLWRLCKYFPGECWLVLRSLYNLLFVKYNFKKTRKHYWRSVNNVAWQINFRIFDDCFAKFFIILYTEDGFQ